MKEITDIEGNVTGYESLACGEGEPPLSPACGSAPCSKLTEPFLTEAISKVNDLCEHLILVEDRARYWEANKCLHILTGIVPNTQAEP